LLSVRFSAAAVLMVSDFIRLSVGSSRSNAQTG
jgi:hypothetical protein